MPPTSRDTSHSLPHSLSPSRAALVRFSSFPHSSRPVEPPRTRRPHLPYESNSRAPQPSPCSPLPIPSSLTSCSPLPIPSSRFSSTPQPSTTRPPLSIPPAVDLSSSLPPLLHTTSNLARTSPPSPNRNLQTSLASATEPSSCRASPTPSSSSAEPSYRTPALLRCFSFKSSQPNTCAPSAEPSNPLPQALLPPLLHTTNTSICFSSQPAKHLQFPDKPALERADRRGFG